MPRTLRIAWAFSLCAFGVMLYIHYLWRIDPRAELTYSRELRRVQALETELDAEVLKERFLHHYDGLVSTLADLASVERGLHAMPTFLSAQARREITERLAACEAATNARAAKVESFKSENAILRNSSRYVPEAAEHLGSHLDAVTQVALVEEVKGTLADVLLYELSPSAARDRRVRERSAKMRASFLSWPAGEVKSEADVLVSHVDKIIEMQPRVTEVTKAILAIPAPHLAFELETAYSSHYRAAIASSEMRRSILFVLALAALGLAATEIILRQRRTEAALVDASARLTRANEELALERAREKELGELKSRFVSVVSHEVRTPLAVVRSSAELLASYWHRWDDDKRAQHLKRIQVSASEMGKLVDGVLVIGRADAGKLEFNPCEIDLEALCFEASAEVKEGIPNAPQVTLAFASDVKLAVVDPRLLRHVIQNLLANAIKYGRDRPVDLEVARDVGEVRFVFRDRGIGIPEDDLPHLFEDFHRAGNVGAIPGTGIGLAVVRRSVDRHGGRIEVKSREGEGTTFTVTIPIEVQAEGEA